MDLKQFVGSKIKEFRLSRGMNQEMLADLLDTTKQSVSRYESGERQANQDMLFLLADIFNKRVDDFFPSRDIDEDPIQDTMELEEKSLNIDGLELEDLMTIKKITEKALSLDSAERKKLMESVRFAIDYFEKLN